MKRKLLPLIVGISLLSAHSALANAIFSFEGEINFQEEKMDLIFDFKDDSSIVTSIKKTAEDQYHLSIKADHVRTPYFDLSSDMESLIEVARQKGPAGYAISGKLWSSYSLIDYKPIRELSGRFEIKNQKLFLDSLSFGNIKCSGYVDLVSPHQLDLAFDLNSIDMDDFLNFWMKEKNYLSSGNIEGSIRVSGAMDKLFLKGILQSYNGFIKNLDYDNIYLNVEGYYPHMQIARSTLSKSDGVSFSFDGPFDLSDRKNFKKQIKSLTLSPLVRDSERESEWTIKKLQLKGAATTELKYLLRKDSITDSENMGMLGLERTVEF